MYQALEVHVRLLFRRVTHERSHHHVSPERPLPQCAVLWACTRFAPPLSRRVTLPRPTSSRTPGLRWEGELVGACAHSEGGGRATVVRLVRAPAAPAAAIQLALARAFFSCSFMLQGVRKKNNAGVKQFGQVPIVFEFPSVATGAREGKSKISYQPPVGGTSKSAL